MAYTSGSPGAGQLEIGIALVLHDRFSNQAREASSQIRKLHMDAKNAINANLHAIQNISQTGVNIARAASAQIKNSVLDGAQFIDTMVTVKAITEATQEEFENLRSTAQTLGVKTMFDSREIASGMQYLAMAGTQAKDIQDMIKGAAMVANATGMQLGGKGGAADLLTNVMRMFKIEASDAAGVVGDQLTKAVLASNISMMDLAEAIKYAGADMVTLRQSLPSVTAMIGTLGNAGMQGSMAGTAISNMARYLNKSISQPSFKGAKALAKIGLGKEDFVNAKGDLVDISIILEKLGKATAGLTSTEQNAVFLDIFGVRGNRAAVAIARDLEGYRSLLEKIQNQSTGFAENVVNQRMASLAGSIDVLKSSLENFRTTYAKSLEPVLSPILKGIGTIVGVARKVFDIPVLGTFLSTLTVAGTLILGLGSAFIMLRTKWLLFSNDSQVTSRYWFSILKGGWAGAILGAKEYLAIQTAIIAQQKTGITGNVMQNAMYANMGAWVGNAKMVRNKHNKLIYFVRDPKTGGVTRATAERAAQAVGGAQKAAFSFVPGSQVPPPVASNAAVASAAASTTMAASAAANLARQTTARATTGLLGRLVGVGGRLLGFLGGPVGLAITAGSFLLPWVIGKLSENSSSTEANTKATEELKSTVREDMLGRLADAKAEADRKLTDEMRNLASIIQYWGMKMANGKTPDVVIHSRIDLDGKPVKEIVEKTITENQNKTNFALNTR